MNSVLNSCVGLTQNKHIYIRFIIVLFTSKQQLNVNENTYKHKKLTATLMIGRNKCIKNYKQINRAKMLLVNQIKTVGFEMRLIVLLIIEGWMTHYNS